MIPRSMVLVLAGGTLVFTARSVTMAPQLLPVYGGASGTAFTRSCGAGKVLTGLRFRAGLLVDAVGLLCRPVNANGSLGTESTVGTLVGGSSGTSGTKSCGSNRVVTGAGLRHGSYIDAIFINCRDWDPSTRKFTFQNHYQGAIGNALSVAAFNEENCASAYQPAISIRGRAGSLVDAIGFICDHP